MMTQTSIEAYRDQAAELFRDVFRTMLRLEAIPVWDNTQPPSQLTAAVFFAGNWKGAALIDCSLQLALTFTSRMMPGCTPETYDDDVRDCMGELANMIGGNLKALLPDGVGLSMPTVLIGNDYCLKVCGHNSYLRMRFLCEGGTFWITIVETAPE